MKSAKLSLGDYQQLDSWLRLPADSFRRGLDRLEEAGRSAAGKSDTQRACRELVDLMHRLRSEDHATAPGPATR